MKKTLLNYPPLFLSSDFPSVALERTNFHGPNDVRATEIRLDVTMRNALKQMQGDALFIQYFKRVTLGQPGYEVVVYNNNKK